MKKTNYFTRLNFLVFPEGCTFYRGPHSMECYRTIWKNIGCLESGWKHPDNFTGAYNFSLSVLNLQ